MWIDVVGWITRQEFSVLYRQINLGYGPLVGFRLSELHRLFSISRFVDDDEAERIAVIRQDQDRALLPDQQVDIKRRSIDLDVDGVAAELAVSDWLGVPFLEKGRPDGGYDFVSRKGNTVDVKTTRTQNNPHLIFKSIDKFKADIAVLTITR